MRRIISVVTLAVAAVLVTGSAALAQGTSPPTSFFGGPDVSTDMTMRGPVAERPDGSVVAGSADETSGESSTPGWLLGLLAAAVVLGGIAFLARRGTRDDVTTRV